MSRAALLSSRRRPSVCVPIAVSPAATSTAVPSPIGSTTCRWARAVELTLRLYQYWCPGCDRAFTPPTPFLAPGSHATERFLEQARQVIAFGDIANAAAFLHVPESSLGRWYYDYLERQPQAPGRAPLQPIRQLGIDELSLKKKHRQFVAVVIDHTNHRVLDVLESREKDRIVAYLQAGKASGQFAQLEEVTTDMWDGYVTAVRDVFGTAVCVTIDRFHVMQNFQEQLTDARRQLQRELAKDEAQALKGTRWLWVTNWENLTAAQQAELSQLQERFPRLRELVDYRETLRQLFEDRTITDAATGTARLQAWIAAARRAGLKGLDAFCRTLENWLDKIANYFVNRASNGRTEGFNHGLRNVLWRAFGMTNFAHFRLRVLDRFGRPRRG